MTWLLIAYESSNEQASATH